MRRTFPWLFVLTGAFATLSLSCGNKTETSTSPTATTTATAAETVATNVVATVDPPTTAQPTDTAATATATSTAEVAAPSTAAATTSTAAAASPSGTAAAGEKQYDCGAKGQKACPMQGWMKSVMGSASSSGDGQKLASALSYVAGKPPPGFGSWSSIASAGAEKAKAGDIDGAKASCKQCHDLYKDKYKKTMRDRPW